MLNPEIIAVLREAAGSRGLATMPTPAELEEIQQWVQRSQQEPRSLVVDLLRARWRAENAEKQCAVAAEAAESLEETLHDMVHNHAALYRLEATRLDGEQTRAICRTGGQMREFPLHPDVDPECLEGLQPWEYVRVVEDVVVGVWAGDPSLRLSAQGEVVAFRGYRDRQRGLVHVAEDGHRERIARLAADLREQDIPAGSKLVLLGDNPHWVVDVLPGQSTHSRFEVPVEKINTRLDDLAGIESVARQLIEEVVVHVLNPDVCREFGLDPMRGFLLSSYKPGMGKTAFVRAFAYWLHELGQEQGFDVVLYFVPPNATKSMWHGEDARIVREDLWGAVRARQAQPRDRGLFQFIVFDEVDSLGKRTDASEMITSSAQSDALESMLSEMDGLVQFEATDGPPAYVLVGGMTNLPERVDEALKRPGRMGDLDLEMPDLTADAAEDILAIYARGTRLPWYVDGQIETDLDESRIRQSLLRPALASVFSTVALCYATDSQRRIEVTAGQILAGVHYKEAMNRAKKQAVLRRVQDLGVPAVTLDDVAENLAAVAQSTACQMAADKKMLVRQLQIKVPVTRVDLVPREEMEDHRYLRVYSA